MDCKEACLSLQDHLSFQTSSFTKNNVGMREKNNCHLGCSQWEVKTLQDWKKNQSTALNEFRVVSWQLSWMLINHKK